MESHVCRLGVSLAQRWQRRILDFTSASKHRRHQTRNPQADLLEDRRHRSAVAVAAKDCEVEEDNGRAAECSGLGRQSGESTFDLWPDFGEP